MPDLVYRSVCPICGEIHSVRSRTSVSDLGPGLVELGVGDELTVDQDLAVSRRYVSINPHERNTPLRFLEDGPVLHGERLWTEVTHANAHITALVLVKMTMAVLDRLHFIAPRSRTYFWDWADDLFDPRSCNDALDTTDDVRALRMKLRLLEPLPARTFDEARLAVPTYGLEAVKELERADNGVWRLTCKTAYNELVLTFTIEDTSPRNDLATPKFGSGRSRIIPPDVFRRLAAATADGTPFYTQDLDANESELVRTALDNTIEYVQQVRAFIPKTEVLVPLDEFLGDAPRKQWSTKPHLYEQRWLDRELSIWLHDRNELGVQRVLPARSVEEADLFMRLHRCSRCGTRTPLLESRVVTRGNDLVSIYEGKCPNCGKTRRFEFEVGDQPDQTGPIVNYGEGKSTLLDPGQWLAAIDLLGAAPESNARYVSSMIAGAYSELLKFFSNGDIRLGPEIIFSRMGWAKLVDGRERFSKESFRNEYEKYRFLSLGR